jgi:hypothetical protein
MATYTAALFETLRAQPPAAAAGGPGAATARGSRVAAMAAAERGGAPAPRAPAAVVAPAPDASLPRELEDCYAVIRFQRGQVAQLRERCATLEEQVAQVREGGGARHAASWRGLVAPARHSSFRAWRGEAPSA